MTPDGLFTQRGARAESEAQILPGEMSSQQAVAHGADFPGQVMPSHPKQWVGENKGCAKNPERPRVSPLLMFCLIIHGALEEAGSKTIDGEHWRKIQKWPHLAAALFGMKCPGQLRIQSSQILPKTVSSGTSSRS